MKITNVFLTTTFLIFAFWTITPAQPLNNFLKYEGVKTLAGLAHPTGSFNTGYYHIYKDVVEENSSFKEIDTIGSEYDN